MSPTQEGTCTVSQNVPSGLTDSIDIIINPKIHHHMYIMRGYCDLNEIIQHKIAIHRNARYQEFMFREGAGGCCVLSHQLTGDHITNHSKPQCQTYPLHIQSSYNAKPPCLNTSNNTHPCTRLIHTKTHRHHHKKTWGGGGGGGGGDIGYISVGWWMGCIRHSQWGKSGPTWFLKPSKSIAHPSPLPTSNSSPFLPHRTPTPNLSTSTKRKRGNGCTK